ncbi:MAG: FkbM family methyltransferase [Candidatus Staskawiczbacteria bacterium]|nr:FkbM family methyltransferase [Candidatus Staskawiczbacteria bacterium]
MILFLKSLILDIRFLIIPKINPYYKLEFILKKYYTISKNYTIGFTAGKSHVNILGESFFYNDKFEPAFLQNIYVDHAFLAKFIKPDSVIIDIGANIGQFNFFCKKFIKAYRVYSFEPIKSTFEVLKQNSPNYVYNLAISSQRDMTMYISKETSLLNSAMQSDIDAKKEMVRTIGLDEVEEIKNEKSIDLLKIDTEGTELDVLKTGIHVLKKSKYILVEASANRKSLGNVIELITFLSTNIPSIRIVEIGRKYINKDKTIGAFDVLFFNETTNY